MPLYRLRFHPAFIDELQTAISYYEEQSKTVGKRFRSATKKQLYLIKKTPLIKSICYDDIRFARINGFPYAIHYSIDTPGHQVLVHTIVSDHQNPDEYWRKRL